MSSTVNISRIKQGLMRVLEERPPEEALVFEASSAFFLTYERLVEHRGKIAKKLYGLNLAETKTLFMLLCAYPAEDVTHAELLAETGLTSGGQSKVLKSLEKGGYISSIPNPRDARSRWITITGKGIQTTEELAPEVASEDLAFFRNSLSAQEFEEFRRLLAKLTAPMRV